MAQYFFCLKFKSSSNKIYQLKKNIQVKKNQLLKVSSH